MNSKNPPTSAFRIFASIAIAMMVELCVLVLPSTAAAETISIANVVNGGPSIPMGQISYKVEFTPVTALLAPESHPMFDLDSDYRPTPYDAVIPDVTFGGWAENTSFQSAKAAADKGSDNSSDYILRQVSSAILPDPDEFSYPGFYEYIAEAKTAGNASRCSDWWQEGAERYRIRLQITGSSPNLTLESVMVEDISASMDGTLSGEDVARGTSIDFSESANSPSEMEFSHTCVKTQNLTVDETVAGSFASLDEEFPFTISFVLPDYIKAATSSILYSVDDNETIGVAVTDGSASAKTGTPGSASFSTSLHHGQKLTISGLPAGSTYSISATESETDTGGDSLYSKGRDRTSLRHQQRYTSSPTGAACNYPI